MENLYFSFMKLKLFIFTILLITHKVIPNVVETKAEECNSSSNNLHAEKTEEHCLHGDISNYSPDETTFKTNYNEYDVSGSIDKNELNDLDEATATVESASVIGIKENKEIKPEINEKGEDQVGKHDQELYISEMFTEMEFPETTSIVNIDANVNNVTNIHSDFNLNNYDEEFRLEEKLEFVNIDVKGDSDKETHKKDIGSKELSKITDNNIDDDELIKASMLIGDDVLYSNKPNYKNKKDHQSRLLYEAETEIKARLSDAEGSSNKSIGPTNEDVNKISETNKSEQRHTFGVLSEFCGECDLGILPIRAAAQKDKVRDTPTSIPEVSIQFADVPLGDGFQIDRLDLSEGTFLFDYLGAFLSWLQPNDFPIELLRDALRNRVSIFELITQSLQLEAGFVTCLVVGILLALAAPVVVLSHTCYRLRRRKKGDDNAEDGPTWAGNCRRRTLVFTLQILIILLMLGIFGVVITNQQVSNAMLEIGRIFNVVLGDLNTFLGNAHLQLHFAVTKHLEQVVQAVDSDLNNAEILLGQPIQAELSRETGVDVALDSLRNIGQDASKVGELVEMVQLGAGLVSEAILLSRDKLSDLRLQVDTFRRQCTPRDRPLCDTISVTGLDVTMRVDFLRQDDKLKRVRQIGGPELRSAVDAARMLYRDIPRQVDADTKTARQDASRQLMQQRAKVENSIRALELFFRNLRSKVFQSQNSVNDISDNIPEMEFWRWIIGLGAAGLILVLWILLQSGISCGCCGSERSAVPTLLICVMLICLVSTALWIVAVIVLLVGGHGEVFMCRPLYQEPDFLALSQLLDKPGLIPGSRNFLAALTYNNDTMDVPLNRILRECQIDHAAYPTFQLKGVLDVDTMTESREWDGFQQKLEKINVKLNHVNVLSPNLHNQLDDLMEGLSVNLTSHRLQLSEALMGKDLGAFAAQLESVGNQLKDLASASRMETLATRTRRLLATHIDPLKEKKENLMYQVTALEVQLGPLQRQVEQSISHLKTIQFFINSQGNSIAEKKTTEYKNRLSSYIDQYRIHLTDTVHNDIARCQPLWNLFHISRLTLCKHVIDPLNGFWFSIVWCLCLLLLATPISLKLVDCYRMISQSGTNHLSGSPSENLMRNEQGRDWATPNGNTDSGSGGGW